MSEEKNNNSEKIKQKPYVEMSEKQNSVRNNV